MAVHATRVRTGAAVLAALASLVLAAGCSSGSSGGGGGGGGGGGATANTTAWPSKTLLIGLNVEESGPTASQIAGAQGFEAYLNYINKQGGVNGYKFTWVARDNAAAAAQGATAQNALLSMNPFLIFDYGSTPTQAAVQVSVNASSKTPLILAADGGLVDQLAAQLPGGAFGFYPDYRSLAAYGAQFIMDKLGIKDFALAYEDDPVGIPAYQEVPKYVASHGGKLSTVVPFDATTTNFGPIAARLQSSGAKAVLGFAGTIAALQKAASAIGYTPKWVTPFFSLSPAYIQLAGAAAEGTYVEGIQPPTSDTSAPGMQTFVTQTSAFAKTAVNSVGQAGWEMAAIMVEGIKKATNGGAPLTQDGYSKAVMTVSGPVGFCTISFEDGRHWGINQANMYQVSNGAFTQVQPLLTLPPL